MKIIRERIKGFTITLNTEGSLDLSYVLEGDPLPLAAPNMTYCSATFTVYAIFEQGPENQIEFIGLA